MPVAAPPEKPSARKRRKSGAFPEDVEHEARLRELLLEQQGINKQLDLDKGDIQAVREK